MMHATVNMEHLFHTYLHINSTLVTREVYFLIQPLEPAVFFESDFLNQSAQNISTTNRREI